MNQICLLLGLGVIPPALVPSVACLAQDIAGPKPSSEAAKPAPSIFGEPLVVNGRQITDAQIKAHLCYGPGRAIYDVARNRVIIDDEIRRQAMDAAVSEVARREADTPFADAAARQAAVEAEFGNQHGLLLERYAVRNAEVEAEKSRMIHEFKDNYPALDLEVEIARAFKSRELYDLQLRTTMLFDHVFLPVNPDDWPLVTSEAVRADSGDILIDDAKQSYGSRKEYVYKRKAFDAAEEIIAAREREKMYESGEAREKAKEEETAIQLERIKQEYVATDEDLPKEDQLYMQIMRDIVRTAVYKLVDFRTQGMGAPPGVALWADTNGDGQPEVLLTVDELWEQVKNHVGSNDIAEAKHYLVTAQATHDRLAREGFLLSAEDCAAALQTFAQRFDAQVFNLESLALTTYNFPSEQSYREYHCLFEGFRRKVDPILQPGPAGELAQPLREYFDKANRIMGLGQVDLDVMLIGAFDVSRHRWKPDGWKWAEAKSREVMGLIEANTREYNEQRAKSMEARAKGQVYEPEKPAEEPSKFWSQMMDEHSGYWDPPAPAAKGQRSEAGLKKRGRFGPHYRNDLINYVGETYFSHWVTGQSITDYAFFEQAEGTVVGPFKGPLGFYLTRVNKRTPPTRGLNLSEPKHLELLREDWLRVAFIEYSQEAVAQAQVSGFQP